MKKLTGYTYLALIYNEIWLLSKCFNLLPNLIEAFCAGFGVILILISAYSQTHDMSNLRDYKKTLFNRVLSKYHK